MCDTLLAPPDSTADRVMLLAKNSDRQRNEAQAVEFFARADHAPDAEVSCTYIAIPQVRRTHAVLLSRPFWIWGAEMGANEHGVVIGNEGLHARSAAPQAEALTGMDLLRLGLERASTAAEAVNTMTELLERWGQGGNCGHLVANYYNNGFLIADAAEAFVLETVGREWLTERVRTVRSLSNTYSIAATADRVSAGLPDLIRNGAWAQAANLNYAAAIADPSKEHIGQANARRARSTAMLGSRQGELSALDMMAILRDHGAVEAADGVWNPRSAFDYTLCMHAGSDARPGQTTGSLVSEIRQRDAVHWVTGTAAPCISIFKPALMDAPLLLRETRPTDRFDARTLWWRHERLHRVALATDFPEFLGRIVQERDALEASFRVRVAEVLSGGSAADRGRVVAECWKTADDAENRWLSHLSALPVRDGSPYDAAWSRMERLAGMDDPLFNDR